MAFAPRLVDFRGRAEEDFAGKGDRFAERRMRMDRSATSSTVAPISMASTASAIRSPAPAPTMPHAEHALGLRIDDHLRQPFGAAVGDRPAAGRPRILGDLDLAAFLLRLVFGEAGPGDFGIGEDDGRNGRLSNAAGSPASTSAATLPSCDALCASIGSPATSPIAKMCGSAVRCCLSTSTKPLSSISTFVFSRPKPG